MKLVQSDFTVSSTSLTAEQKLCFMEACSDFLRISAMITEQVEHAISNDPLEFNVSAQQWADLASRIEKLWNAITFAIPEEAQGRLDDQRISLDSMDYPRALKVAEFLLKSSSQSINELSIKLIFTDEEVDVFHFLSFINIFFYTLDSIYHKRAAAGFNPGLRMGADKS